MHDLSHKVEGLRRVLQHFKAQDSKEFISAEETLHPDTDTAVNLMVKTLGPFHYHTIRW